MLSESKEGANKTEWKGNKKPHSEDGENGGERGGSRTIETEEDDVD